MIYVLASGVAFMFILFAVKNMIMFSTKNMVKRHREEIKQREQYLAEKDAWDTMCNK